MVQDAPPQVSSWALYRRLLGYVRPYWRIFALAVVGMIVVAVADYSMATLVGPLIANFEQPAPGLMIRLPLMIAGVFLSGVRHGRPLLQTARWLRAVPPARAWAA